MGARIRSWKSNASRVLSPIEQRTLALHRVVYLRDRVSYDEHVQHHDSALGTVCSGGTLGDIMALWCARNAYFRPCSGFDSVEKEGWAATLQNRDAEGAAILGSERPMQKAAAVFSVRAVAGWTDRGGIDSLAGFARRKRIYFLVDGWGLSLLSSPLHRGVLGDIGAADTVALGGEEQLYVPDGCMRTFAVLSGYGRSGREARAGHAVRRFGRSGALRGPARRHRTPAGASDERCPVPICVGTLW